LKDLKKGRGGTRPGAGMPKGYKTRKTLTKEAARDALRTLVLKQMERLVAAQLANATGLRHTFMRDATGKFTQLTNPQQIADALNSGDEGKYYWTFTKDPSVQAFTDLMNRALDKPAEQVQQLEHSGTIAFRWQA
jgi:hypothetical protein